MRGNFPPSSPKTSPKSLLFSQLRLLHRIVAWTMALHSGYFTVYVAFYFVAIALLNFSSATQGIGGSNVLSLLQPYDFLYYSGVRAYFGEEWLKAAELLEKSVATKESLFRVRRQCRDDCEAAGRQAFNKLGKFIPIVYFVCVCVRVLRLSVAI